jgi:hypothetical protein
MWFLCPFITTTCNNSSDSFDFLFRFSQFYRWWIGCPHNNTILLISNTNYKHTMHSTFQGARVLESFRAIIKGWHSVWNCKTKKCIGDHGGGREIGLRMFHMEWIWVHFGCLKRICIWVYFEHSFHVLDCEELEQLPRVFAKECLHHWCNKYNCHVQDMTCF